MFHKNIPHENGSVCSNKELINKHEPQSLKHFSPNRFTCGVLSWKKNRLDTLLGALGLVGRGFGPAGRAGLGWAWGLAVLGALAGLGVVLGVLWVGRGVWLCWARWLGWAWGLPVLGALAGLGVVLGVLGALAGWCWAWGLAVLGVLAGLGVVLGVGFGRASWVGRGVGRGVWPCWARWLGWAWCWACWARWLGWAWCWAWGLAVLGALAGLGVVLGAGFGQAARASWVGRGVGRGVWPCWARWLGWVGFGRAGRAGWVGRGVGRAGRAGWVGRGVGRAGRAGWVGRAVGRGVWPRLARWLGWGWCWAPGLAVLGALAGLGVVLGVGFARAGRAGWVGRGFKVQKYTLEIFKSRLSKYTSILSKYKNTLANYTKYIYKYANIL